VVGDISNTEVQVPQCVVRTHTKSHTFRRRRKEKSKNSAVLTRTGYGHQYRLKKPNEMQQYADTYLLLN